MGPSSCLHHKLPPLGMPGVCSWITGPCTPPQVSVLRTPSLSLCPHGSAPVCFLSTCPLFCLYPAQVLPPQPPLNKPPFITDLLGFIPDLLLSVRHGTARYPPHCIIVHNTPDPSHDGGALRMAATCCRHLSKAQTLSLA